MPHAKRLSGIKKVKIQALSEQNLSGQAISDVIKRLKSCVNSYMERKNKPRVAVKVGRPELLTPRSERALGNVARKCRMQLERF